MKNLKIVGIVGSPRKNKNTDVFVQKVLDGCVSKGADIEKIYLNDLNIQPCRACKVQDGEGCQFHDDMDVLYHIFETADALVIGTPNYYHTVSSQIKLMIDRSYCLAKKVILPEGKQIYPTSVNKKKIGMFICIADVSKNNDHIKNIFSSWAREINLKFIDNIIIRHKDYGKNVEAMSVQNLLKKAYYKGKIFYETALKELPDLNNQTSC